MCLSLQCMMNECDWEKFRDVRKEVSKCSKRSYFDYVSTICLESQKQFYSFIKKLKNESVGIQSLRGENGMLTSTSKEKAEILNRQFESDFTNEDPLPKVKDVINHTYPSLPNFEVTPGVAKLLNDLQRNKACGPDGVPAKILKITTNEIAPGLTLVFNKSLETGCLPQDWLTENITPI